MRESHTPKPIPTVLHGYPVMSAIRDREYGNVWMVLCRRTEEHPWVGDERYITYKAWWSETSGRYETENGHYGAAHGMTYEQAHRDLLHRAGGRSGRINELCITDGPYDSGWTLIDGQRITFWVDRPSPEYCRIGLCTESGIGCGDATLGLDGLCIQLPIDWTTQDKARAAALIAAAAYAMPVAAADDGH